MNDPDKTAARRATIRERIARFVEPGSRTRRRTVEGITPRRRSDPDEFRRLPNRVHPRDVRTTQAIPPMRAPTNDRETDLRYACDDLGDS